MNPEPWICRVREGHCLFYIDLPNGGADDGAPLEIWARAGEYVDATHPVLRAIVRMQGWRVLRLKPRYPVPPGAVFHTRVGSASVRARMAQYDRYSKRPKTVRPKTGITTPIALLIGPDGSAVPVS